MLYLAIPAHNEVATIGVLLWRIRTVLAEFPREYEVVVYDDASTDATADVASQYEQAMPVTVIRGEKHLGYAGAVDRVLRHVAQLTRYPRRDAVLLLQGDFTDPPGIVPEFARRFEGGADLVVGERLAVADAPVAVRRLFKAAQWAMKPFVRVEGVKDTTASMRLVRISALRDAMRAMGDAPLVTGDTWTTNADLLLRLAPHARRVEAVPMEPTYGVRMRETRRVALRDALSALKWAWGARGRRAVVGSSAEPVPESERRNARGAGGKRREEAPELSVDRLREKIRERDGSRGIDGEPEKPRTRGRGRDRERERTERPERAERSERPARNERPERTERAARTDGRAEGRGEPKPERAPRPRRERGDAGAVAANGQPGSTAPAEPRAPKAPRPERPARPRREEGRGSAAAELILDDPFAPPAPKVDPFTRAMDARSAATESAASPDASEPLEPRTDDARGPMAELRPTDDSDGREHEPDVELDSDQSDDEGGDPESADAADGEPRRRRRRNRRSRRGRRRREDAGTEAGSEGSRDTSDAAATDEAPVLEGQPVAFERPRRAERTETADDAGDTSADDGADDGSDDGDEGSQARARRRGRRGRRGGARRSRGRRDRSRSDGGDEGGGSDASPGAPDAE